MSYDNEICMSINNTITLLGLEIDNYARMQRSELDNDSRMQGSELENYARMQRSASAMENMNFHLNGRSMPLSEIGTLDVELDELYGDDENTVNPELSMP